MHGASLETTALGLASALLLTGCYEAHGGGAGCRAESAPPALPSAVEAVLVVEPVAPELALGGEGSAGVPLVAWDGASWNVAWGDRFAVLDAAGTPRGRIEPRPEGGDATALDVGGCRRGVTAAGARPGESAIAWVGSDGVVEGAAEVPGIDADIARGGDRWWIVSDASSEAAGPRIGLFEADDAGTSVARRRAWIAEGSLASPRVVSLDDGAAVSWVDREGIALRELGPARMGAAFRVMTANVWARGAMDAAVLRSREGAERVVVAASDGAMVHVALVDPGARRVTAGPLAITRTTARRARPGIAPLPELDAIAICVPSGPGPWGGPDVIDRVEVIVIGRDAAPMARRVDVAPGGRVSAVSCAWSGRELMVASWRPGESGGIFTQRMRVGVPGSAVPISEPW